MFPKELKAPFEGCDDIAGAVFPCSEGGPKDAALIRHRFSVSAVDLPIHIHPLSDRLLIITHGNGFMHYSNDSFEGFDGSAVLKPLRAGSVICFTRGQLHTFSAALVSEMPMLSLHYPFVELEDERQWTLPQRAYRFGDSSTS